MASLESTTAADFIPTEPGAVPGLLIGLPAMAPDSFSATVANLVLAFPGQELLIASPDSHSEMTSLPTTVRILSHPPAAPAGIGSVLTAADYLNAYKLAVEQKASICVLLGAEAQSLHPGGIRELALAATRYDLVMACYELGPREALVNSAMLYPVTRAIYGARPRYPLGLDIALSLRMLERLATAAQKYTAVNQNDALIWPVAEASAANFTITEVEVGTRTIPQPNVSDLNSLLTQIAGSMFADVEQKQSYWQRARGVPAPRQLTHSPSVEALPDVQPMLDSFRLAYTNLHEIWSLVLPPNSLLGLKRLSQMPAATFRMPDALWSRIVYDFILAYRLRTINRGHLLGALTPLYLAWVASHILLANSGTSPEDHVESQAIAFETDKPYLVSRWRWPDRFNP